MRKTINRTGNLEWAISSHALRGQEESGDLHLVMSHDHGMLVGVVDGLGHGSEAAYAAQRSISTLSKYSHESVITLVRRCHEELVKTRGVVMSLASFSSRDDTMTWIAVGNVEAIYLKQSTEGPHNLTHILHRGGVVGYQLPPLIATVMPVSRGDILIMATDGIKPEFSFDLRIGETPEETADLIGKQFRKENDDALVLVARYL